MARRIVAKINRKHLPQWSRHLTVDEIRHLKECDAFRLSSLQEIKRNIQQIKHDHPVMWTHRVCLDCNHILNKLEEARVWL